MNDDDDDDSIYVELKNNVNVLYSNYIICDQEGYVVIERIQMI